MNGKGSDPRPRFVSDKEYADNYALAFGKRREPLICDKKEEMDEDDNHHENGDGED